MCVIIYICSLPFTLSARSTPPPRESGVILWMSPVVPSNVSHLPLTDLFLKHDAYHVSPPASNSSVAPQCLHSYIYTIFMVFMVLYNVDANLFSHFYLPPVPLQIDRSLFRLFFSTPKSLKLLYDSHTSQLITQLITISIYRNAINPSIAHLK